MAAAAATSRHLSAPEGRCAARVRRDRALRVCAGHSGAAGRLFGTAAASLARCAGSPTRLAHPGEVATR